MKQIIGYTNYYIDEYGNILNTYSKCYLKPYKEHGYLKVTLYK